jgi:hypothetical protein
MSPPESPTVSAVMTDKPSTAATLEEMVESHDVDDESPRAETSNAAADSHLAKDESAQLKRGDNETAIPQIGIRYTVDCFDPNNGRNFKISQNDKPLDIQVSSPIDTSPATPVIELITYVDVRSRVQGSEESAEKMIEGTTAKGLEDYTVARVRPSSLLVRSEHLTQALRDVVEYYPRCVFNNSEIVLLWIRHLTFASSQNLVGETIIIPEPFAVLAHHADQLMSMMPPNDQDQATSFEGNTENNHLSVLLNFMLSNVKSKYETAKKRLMHPTTPTVAFEDVWYLLRPGLKA